VPVERVREDAAEQDADRASARRDEAEDAHRLGPLGGLGDRVSSATARRPRRPRRRCLDRSRRTRNPCEFASPQQSEARVKSVMAREDNRRWPKRSPSRPPRSRSRRTSAGRRSRPRRARSPRSEILPDRRQRDVHDRDVEHDHQPCRGRGRTVRSSELRPSRVMSVFLSARSVSNGKDGPAGGIHRSHSDEFRGAGPSTS